MQYLNAYNLKFIHLCTNSQCRPRQRGDKSERAITQFLQDVLQTIYK